MPEAAAPWPDPDVYPFEPHYHQTPAGRMHYVDEGQGEPIVFLHGQPSWSFMYRAPLAGLASRARCIGVDWLGFGRSDKPRHWHYRIDAHAENLDSLIEALGLDGVTLVVHDWGGPIGLGWAVRHPERVKRLVILNTWMWSFAGERWARVFSRSVGSAPGRLAIRHLDLFVRVFMKRALAHVDGGRHWERVRAAYQGQFQGPQDRQGCAVFPQQILGASPWLEETWRLASILAAKPTLFVWGEDDPVFRREVLERLCGAFPRNEVQALPGIGHFVAEELGDGLTKRIAGFLDAAPAEPG